MARVAREMNEPDAPYARARSCVSRDKGYQRSLDVHRALEALYPRIEEHSAYFRVMMPVDPRLPTPPGRVAGVRLDPIVCAIAIKAATTKRGVLALCELGDGESALILARVVLENACLVEWLIRGTARQRLEAYAMFTSVAYGRVVEIVKKYRQRFVDAGADPQHTVSDPYHQAVWQHVFRDRKGKKTSSDRPTWAFDSTSGHWRPFSAGDLFREMGPTSQSFEYDVLYGEIGSELVHTGPFSLTRTLQVLQERRTFILQPTPIADNCTIALASSNTAMLLVFDALTEYLGLDLSPELEPLKARSKEDPYAPVILGSPEPDAGTP